MRRHRPSTLSSSAVLLLLLLCSVSFSQQLIKKEFNGKMSVAALNEQIKKRFSGQNVPEAVSEIELYKITYASLDTNNKRTTLSGLVVLPIGGAPKGLIVYCHGTTVDRRRSPSNFKGTGEAPEILEAISALGTSGYAVAMPDYIGLGDNKSAHPYPLNKVNAASGRDMISAVRSFALQKKYSIAAPLFITGYSEGGGVAMALTNSLSSYTNKEYRVTASAPASGPYDLSGATRNFMMEETGDQTGFIIRLYLLSYAANYLSKEKGVKLNTIFKRSLANAISLNYRLNPKDEGLIKNIGVTTALMRSKNQLSNVLQPDFIQEMRSITSNALFVRLLRENDTYSWEPKAPMLLIYVDKDAIVSPQNTEIAYNTMQRRGVSSAILRKVAIPESYDHITGIAPALAKVRAFFDGGFAAVPDAR